MNATDRKTAWKVLKPAISEFINAQLEIEENWLLPQPVESAPRQRDANARQALLLELGEKLDEFFDPKPAPTATEKKEKDAQSAKCAQEQKEVEELIRSVNQRRLAEQQRLWADRRGESR